MHSHGHCLFAFLCLSNKEQDRVSIILTSGHPEKTVCSKFLQMLNHNIWGGWWWFCCGNSMRSNRNIDWGLSKWWENGDRSVCHDSHCVVPCSLKSRALVCLCFSLFYRRWTSHFQKTLLGMTDINLTSPSFIWMASFWWCIE